MQCAHVAWFPKGVRPSTLAENEENLECLFTYSVSIRDMHRELGTRQIWNKNALAFAMSSTALVATQFAPTKPRCAPGAHSCTYSKIVHAVSLEDGEL